MTALAILHREEIITQVAQGRLLKQVAADLGITHAAISQQLAQDPEYKTAREIGAEARLENEYERIEAAPDALTLARARETFRAASWFAEREFPARWGQKSQVTNINVDAGQWGDRLRRARERVIEPENDSKALQQIPIITESLSSES